jgi:hypothetical protein
MKSASWGARAWIGSCLSVALLLMIPGLVWTQSSEDCETRTLILHEAINKYSNFEEEKAVSMFEQVLEFDGCPEHESITANQFLGDYYRGHGDPTKMEEYFLKALRIDPRVAIHPIVRQSKPFYEEVRADNFKRVTITSVPDSADVFLDGELIGPSPVSIEYLEVGRHIVDLRHPDDKFSATIDTVEVEDEQSVTFQMRTKTVKMMLDSDPSSASVFYAHTDPPTEMGVTPYEDVFEWGTVQEIVLTKSGYEATRVTIEMNKETVEKQVPLSQLQGQLELKYRPKDAIVYIDGSRATKAVNGRLAERLPIGDHKIRVAPSEAGHESQTETVIITEDKILNKTIKLRSVMSRAQRVLTDDGSTGILNMNYPYSYGEGVGFNVLAKADRVEPQFPNSLGLDIGNELDKTFVTTGMTVVGSGNRWLTLGTAFVFMLASQKVVDETAPEGVSDEIKWAAKSVSTIKLTLVEKENASWSIQGTVDVPVFINGYFPRFSHPIFMSWEDTPKVDYGAGTSLAVRGKKFEIIVNAELTKYGESAQDMGFRDEVISENSILYNAAIGIGDKNQFFAQFGGEVFDIMNDSYIAKSELPMSVAIGGRFYTPESVFVLALGASLVTDDEETWFNPTLVYPVYTAEISVGDSRSYK